MLRKLLSVQPKFWLFALTLLTVLFVWIYAAQSNHLARQMRTLEDLQSDRLSAIEANAALQHEIDFTYTDEYIEREARGKLGYVYPGETLFKSID